MQHWLNMQLCDHLGISMNIDCPMPTRYVWDLCRQVLGSENIPLQSPYKREVLTWKIYELCQSQPCKQADFYPQLSRYWMQASTELDQARRMFSFARQLADLFEQYLVFRPDWLQQWESNQSQNFSLPRYKLFEHWQQWFWQQLVAWIPAHPVSLQFEAIAALAERKQALPKDIYIFSINSISPIYLTFFDEISQHTNVHLFQLNPCVNYWGDSQSDIAIAKMQRKQALALSLDENAVHPLLRNLGAQGRDLNNLLADMQHQEIAAFDIHVNAIDANTKHMPTVLQQLQQDILSGSTEKRVNEHDGSIAVHACHNEVRELQVLKDVLLDKFAEISDLQPKDILVMCPSIEAYSPYIRSVFTQSAQPALNLPISISDRQPIESQSYIVAFMQLLSLPTTRFDASGIVDLISLPALADKYNLSPQDIDICATWLKDAAIDWGKDTQHLSQHIGDNISDDMHTWHWGISRLLVGMINAANETLVDGYSPVTYIEGQSTIVLGRFLQALESLERVTKCFEVSQNITQWTKTLVSVMNDNLQANEGDSFAQKLLVDAIYSLQKNTLVAGFDGPIELPILHEALTSVLSIPEVRSQFYSGNITFCSMLPMRSIPFKVIAILGLNQRDFPRQDNPIEIDLMQASAPRRGDRSRRGDDRYLFLESLVSARQYLHLSFQHRHIKNNSVREPSLVVKMLVDYCHQHYSKGSLIIVEHALHPFSPDSFLPKLGYSGSYDAGWFTCLESVQKSHTSENVLKTTQVQTLPNLRLHQKTAQPLTLNIQEVVKFLKGSLPYYAKQVLTLYLEKPSFRDFAPAYSIDGLTQYALRVEVVKLLNENNKCALTNFATPNDTHVNNTNSKSLLATWVDVRKTWLLSGKLPFLVGVEDELDSAFLDTFALEMSLPSNKHKRRAKGKLILGHVTLEYDFYYDLAAGIKLVRINPKAPSLSHFIEPWIQYLILLIHVQTDDEFIQFQRDTQNNTPADMSNEDSSYGMSGELGEVPINEQLSTNSLPKFGVHIHYIDPSVNKGDSNSHQALKQVNICQLFLAVSDNATEVLSKIVNVFEKGCKRPILIDLSLAAEVMKFASVDEALESKALMAKWSTCNQATENGPDLFPRTYFDFLLGAIPAFDKDNIQSYFDCFGAIEQFEPKPITVDISEVNYPGSFKSEYVYEDGQ
jgi:exodeoxyribonuclease V gamma subunit